MIAEKKLLKSQFKALGRSPIPEYLSVDGVCFRFREEIKHSFAVAVAVFESESEKVVVKLHRQTGFFGIPLKWAGELMARYEKAVLKHCGGIEGIPNVRTTNLRAAVVHDYIPGSSLRSHESVDSCFPKRLLQLLEHIHDRGVAYVDLEKPENILKGDDGRPYLIDFQVAFFWPEHVPLSNSTTVRFLRRCLQKCDDYHAYKHLKRICPDMLSRDQHRLGLKKPWPVRVANTLLIPWQLLRKITGCSRS